MYTATKAQNLLITAICVIACSIILTLNHYYTAKEKAAKIIGFQQTEQVSFFDYVDNGFTIKANWDDRIQSPRRRTLVWQSACT